MEKDYSLQMLGVMMAVMMVLIMADQKAETLV